MSSSTTIAVTGSSGFVGSRLVEVLANRGHTVRGLTRRPETIPSRPNERIAYRVVPNLRDVAQLTPAFAGACVLVHLAARAHVMKDDAADPEVVFREANVAVSGAMARAAAAAGVHRIVFVSSIKVNGESSGNCPFHAGDPPAPADPYGRSKLEAEALLTELCGNAQLQLCIVRPVLVYGPGVKGNMLRLMRLIARGAPLPFGSVDNRRSILGLDNLCDLLERCAVHPSASGRVFLAADPEPLSTPAMIREIAEGIGRSARLFPVPPALVRAGGRFIRRSDEVRRLLDSLIVDSAECRTRLGWKPPVSTSAGLRAMGIWFRESATRTGRG